MSRLLRGLLGLSAAACLSACANVIVLSEVDKELFVAADYRSRAIVEPRITWVVRDDYETVCSRMTGIVAGPIHKLMGCAHWNEKTATCTVVMGYYYSPVYLGHEVRHCFEGNFH